MAFRQPQMQFFQGVSLKHEDQIQQQYKQCREAFNLGDRELIKNTVEALLLCVTDKMIIKDYVDLKKGKHNLFLNELDDIEAYWKKENDKIHEDYEKEVAEAGCPDVVEEPNPIPPINYFQKKFQAAANRFERSGLMFTYRVEVDER